MKSVKVHDRTFEVMIPAAEIRRAVERVAQRINATYSTEDNLLIVGVLNGAFVFMSDLVRELNFHVEISFVKISSYVGDCSTGVVKELIGLNQSLEGRNVVIVDDIIETGNSMCHLMKQMEQQGACSVRSCALFYKPNAYRGDRPVDFPAMEIGDEFIIGYGLDYNEFGRELKDIYVTKDE